MRFLLFFPHNAHTFFSILCNMRIYLFAARLNKRKDKQVKVKLEHFFLERTEKQHFLET